MSSPNQNPKNSKPQPKEITAADLSDYLDNEWDFAFELAVLKKLKAMQFEVEHGGTYMDSVTEKHRQFDIRAVIRTPIRTIRLAVECKNLKKMFPLLVTCVPRTSDEAFQDIIFSVNRAIFRFRDVTSGQMVLSRPTFKHVRLSDFHSIYGTGKPVGKVVTNSIISTSTIQRFMENGRRLWRRQTNLLRWH